MMNPNALHLSLPASATLNVSAVVADVTRTLKCGTALRSSCSAIFSVVPQLNGTVDVWLVVVDTAASASVALSAASQDSIRCRTGDANAPASCNGDTSTWNVTWTAVIAAVTGIAAVALVILLCCCCRRSKRRSATTKPDDAPALNLPEQELGRVPRPGTHRLVGNGVDDVLGDDLALAYGRAPPPHAVSGFSGL